MPRQHSVCTPVDSGMSKTRQWVSPEDERAALKRKKAIEGWMGVATGKGSRSLEEGPLNQKLEWVKEQTTGQEKPGGVS